MCFGIAAAFGGAFEKTKVAVAAEDYYSSITETGGIPLLGQVHDLVSTTHKVYTTYNDCKNPDYVSKTDPGKTSGTVMEFYSQADIASSWGAGASGTWNREHVWCQSLSNGMWGEKGGGSDLHHIRPVESALNSTRNNSKYGEVENGKEAWYKDKNKNQIAIGGHYANDVFEPINDVKGDVARIVLYVYMHYNTYTNVGGSTNGSGNSDFFGKLNFTNVISANSESEAIELLLSWNKSDPVSPVEITRNEAVYQIQGNRNPFIDHPEYAEAIWGDGTAIPEVESITLNKTSLTLSMGRSEQLTVTAHPANALTSVEWTSSDEEVATVSANGVVTAVAEGTAQITVTSKSNPSIKATATVTVEKSDLSLATITLDSFDLTFGYGFKDWSAGGISGTAYIYGGSSSYPASSLQFNKNQSSYYIASNTAATGGIKSVTVKSTAGSADRTWKLLTSTSPYGNVAGKPTDGKDRGTKTVTADGVTWIIDGSDTYFALTYEFAGGTASAAAYLESIVVEYGETSSTPAPSPSIEIEKLVMHPEKYELTEGANFKLFVTAEPAGASAEVIWRSSDTSVATVSANGTVTAVKAGTATITATSKENSSVKATCALTVVEEDKEAPPVTLESITIRPSSISIKEGGNSKLSITCEPAEAKVEVIWSSSNESVVQVAQDGTIIGVSAGEATVTATYRYDASIKATVKVTVKAIETQPDDTNINEFHKAVADIVTDGTLAERLTSINAAIAKYSALSDTEKVTAADDIAALKAAIAKYNEEVNAYNEKAESADKAALGKAR